MHTILEMDEHNYDEALPEIRRTAVRGVIFRAGKLLMIRSSFGEVKFPGGGQEQDENDVDTLLREVREETGYHVLPESIRPFGQVVERRLSTYEPMIWHQINRYYFCSIGKEQDACQYSENEQKYGMHQVWVSWRKLWKPTVKCWGVRAEGHGTSGNSMCWNCWRRR